MEKVNFSVRINNGPVQEIEAVTGIYVHAAVAAMAMLEHEPLKLEPAQETVSS